MLRFLLAVLGALALAGCQSEPPKPAREWPSPSPALWHVTGRNGEQAWLFGTIHALPDGAEWRTPAFEKAFAESDLLVVEIGNLGDAQEAADAFQAFAKTSPQPKLSTRVAAADQAALAALMQRAGMSDDDFWDVKTWAAALMLANAVRDSEAGNGVDRALLEAGKPVEGLETFSGQFGRFDGLSPLQQRDLLAGIAHEAAQDQTDERIEAWLTGDIAALETQMNQGYLMSPALRKALLTDRNHLFAAKVAATLEQGRKPFVAVGAAHMLRSDGLPALLAKRGYEVKRIQ
ncbi:TraB/GumN family protein [Altererythrobacter sp. Root672]|uniref:TraB/GumN family protein n=1 Tax=Altererythrobacter sp. Root672 TaxID=1736584 RepID=UPI0006FAFF69|nr:TraB/GumN family protein [Altererythrobacter sp. Root672]KRA83284.1 hypothetical protein ASD76_04275 [Altererythrobacter sp. Root672]